MSKFSPTASGNIFVVPDLHGKLHELNLILDRILPLRDNKNAKDKLIFLGDTPDRGPDTPGVFDKLIELRKEYSSDQVVFLRGNHDQMLLSITGRVGPSFSIYLPSDYSLWINNGGDLALQQWAARKGVEIKNPKLLTIDRAISFIDPIHMDFLKNETVLYHEHENYVFVHAGCDPNIPMNEQDEEVLLWDRSLYATVKKIISQGKELPWNKCVICGHCYDGPFINSKFMMLDCSAKDKLLVVELNSMEAYWAENGKDRMVRVFLEETKVRPALVRRADG